MNLLLVNCLAWALVVSFGVHAEEEASSALGNGSVRSLQSTIDCRFSNLWSDLTPAQACAKLNDPAHPVPYKCVTTGKKLCCAVSNLTTATFDNLGKCTKVSGTATVPTTPTTPAAKPPTRRPTKAPTKKPSSTTSSGANAIDCKWQSYFKDYTAVQACKKLNLPSHPTPYLCEDGRKVCCNASNYATATVGGFGKCTKVQV
ncbi:hypothetical protein ACHAXH_002247 [Discostella pseudostelligera]